MLSFYGYCGSVCLSCTSFMYFRSNVFLYMFLNVSSCVFVDCVFNIFICLRCVFTCIRVGLFLFTRGSSPGAPWCLCIRSHQMFVGKHEIGAVTPVPVQPGAHGSHFFVFFCWGEGRVILRNYMGKPMRSHSNELSDHGQGALCSRTAPVHHITSNVVCFYVYFAFGRGGRSTWDIPANPDPPSLPILAQAKGFLF